jgi:hypothetical protein
MNSRCLLPLAFLAALAALSVSPNRVQAQAADALSSIDGETFADDVQDRFFNREQCGVEDSGGTGGTGGVGGLGGMGGTAGMGGIGGVGGMGGGLSPAIAPKAASDVSFEIRLDQSIPPTDNQVWLWIGKDGANCQSLAERDGTLTNCAEMAGNPRTVDTDFRLTDLVLQDLLDPRVAGTQIASCESSGRAGTRYQIFIFRAAPSGDVGTEAFGIAPFFIDVTRPDPPNVNTGPQRQANFTVSWSTPSPTDDIQSWALFFSLEDDPNTVDPERVASSTFPDERSLTVSASSLGLGNEETGYLFARAYDTAFVNDNFGGNESELSASVMVTAVPVGGVCDVEGNCTGCAATNGAAPLGAEALLFLAFAIGYSRRSRR